MFFFVKLGEIMNLRKLSSERGQGLVLVALMFLAFAAILALVLDGGNAYSARRQAQNAADAGALAGASYMCGHRDVLTNIGDTAGGANIAVDYAVNKNGATSAVASANWGGSPSVVVTATVQKETFFAGLIGISQVSPRAVAEARCRPPAGMGVLPVAWACRSTVVGGLNLPGIDCAQKFGPCADLSCIYILMDSVKVQNKGGNCDETVTDPTDPRFCNFVQNDLVCSAHLPTDCSYVYPNTTDCDLENDCVDELMTGGSRSWLDLNGGGGGASELSNWIQYGFPNPIPPHTWLPEEAGVATSIFKDAQIAVGKNVILPVFDKLCPNNVFDWTATETTAQCNAGPDDDVSLTINNQNYHVITFSQFHVTCVQTAKNKALDESGSIKSCPGHNAAVVNGSIDDNDKTIEGYFTKDQIYGYGGKGDLVDTGTFVVVLVR